MTVKNYSYEKGNKLAQEARGIIPGGAHTYSKGDDQFPERAPKIIQRGKGCYIWDVDGNKFLDFGMSLGTITLGHAYEPVLKAVREELENGVNFVRPSYMESKLAKLLIDIIPCAEMIKFAKHGSDATTGAIKLARAYTGKKCVVRCQDDPFNAVHDWFIGSTVVNRGVPNEIAELTLKFKYNDLDGLTKLFEERHEDIACIIFEPISFIEPKEGYLEGIRELCNKYNIVLIFDEVVSGFRYSLGGVQEMTGVTPDLAAFGKAMANGFSVSALAGKKDIMKLGGMDHDEERVFLLSTTHGGETHSLAAAYAAITEIKEKNIISHFDKIGGLLKDGINALAKKHGAEDIIQVVGFNCKPAVLIKDKDGAISMEGRTLFLQETLDRGLMMPYIVPSFAHTEKEVTMALEIIDEVIPTIRDAIRNEKVLELLQGNPVKPVFRKFN